MLIQNETNSTNNSFISLCEIPQTTTTFEEFSDCYSYFFFKNPTKSVLEIFLFSVTILMNFTVVMCLLLKKKISTFDQIIVGHGKDI